jgi:hypothetical protein
MRQLAAPAEYLLPSSSYCDGAVALPERLKRPLDWLRRWNGASAKLLLQCSGRRCARVLRHSGYSATTGTPAERFLTLMDVTVRFHLPVVDEKYIRGQQLCTVGSMDYVA